MTPDQHARLVRVEEDIKALRQDINKFKGFIGGVVFIVSGLWALLITYLRHL